MVLGQFGLLRTFVTHFVVLSTVLSRVTAEEGYYLTKFSSRGFS